MSNHHQIALEDIVIRNIEPDEGGIQANVCIGHEVAEQVLASSSIIPLPEGKMPFQPVQALEQYDQMLFVRFLCSCKATLVHSIVDCIVNPLVHLIDLFSQFLRIKPRPVTRLTALPDILWQEIVELGVEHPNDLAALVVHDRLGLLVPQDGHGEAATVLRVRFQVQLTQLLESVKRIFCIAAMAAREQPPVFGELGVADDELDQRFEALERADDGGAVGPGAGEVDVEGITISFGGVSRPGGSGDGGTKLTGFAAELAVWVGMSVDVKLLDEMTIKISRCLWRKLSWLWRRQTHFPGLQRHVWAFEESR